MPAMAIPRKVRKNPRAQVSLVARYRSPTAFEYVEEECHDLSLGGMFIRSLAPAPAGTLIKLECDVAGGSRTIRGVARVVWLRDSSGNGQPAGMGVKFIKLDPGARDAIKAILDELVATEADRDSAEPPERIESQRVRRDSAAHSQAEPESLEASESLSGDVPDPQGTDLDDGAAALDAAAPDGAASPFDPGVTPDPPEDVEADSASPAAHADRVPAERPQPLAAIRPGAMRHVALGAGVLAVALGALWFARGRTPEVRARQTALKPAPVAQAPAPPPAAVVQPQQPVVKYVLDLITNPAGAEAALGEQRWTTPVSIELPGPAAAGPLSLSKPGFEPMTIRIDERGFALEEDVWRRRLVLSLTPVRETSKRARPRNEGSPDARLQAASRCLARGDNRCVIRTLEGRARSPRELEMLVETYRATGNLAKAQQNMRAYVAKYPTGDRAIGYRQMLDRQGKEPKARSSAR